MQQGGKIIRYFDDRGYGFIRPDDGGPDVFLHVHGMASGHQPVVGARVMFDVEIKPGSGKPRAIDVTPG